MVDGQRLRFRLIGINNQNFVMEDEETGTWWQQVSGEAILGPLKGRRLTLVPHDEVAFEIWRREHPGGTVLRPDPRIEERDDYARPDWEVRMRDVRTVTPLPEDSPLEARTLVVGISAGGTARAYPLARLRQFRAIVDAIGDVPVVLVVAEDGRSVRVFDRRVDGVAREFVVTPGDGRPTLIDVESGSEWDFAGVAVTGPLAGRTLSRVPFLLEYWFDWRTYNPDTELFRTWRPPPAPDSRPRIPPPEP